MQALRDKAQSGASEKEMDATRDKYDKYDESKDDLAVVLKIAGLR